MQLLNGYFIFVIILHHTDQTASQFKSMATICPFFILIHYFVLSFHSHFYNLPHLTNFTTTSSQRATKYPSYIMVKIDEADCQMFYEFSDE